MARRPSKELKSSSQQQFFSGLNQSAINPTLPSAASSSSSAGFSSGLMQSNIHSPQSNSASPFASGLAESIRAEHSPKEQSSIKKTWQIQSHEFKKSKLIGKGSYGQVYLGEYHHESVAIKIYDFQGQLPAKQQAEIFHEAEIMAGLRSQFLVGFRGICVDPQYCLIMEYCEGGTLRKHLDNQDVSISFVDQLRWGKQISYGLYQLHVSHIFHRDLKGENILLNSHYDAKIADFGLSIVKTYSSEQSSRQGHSTAGTLPWMAPELFSGESNTAAADVYSLGMILWEIISRKKPFHGINPHTIVGMALAGTRPPLGEKCPALFRKLISACWQSDPTKRPTAQAVGDEFKAVLNSIEGIPSGISDPDFDKERSIASLTIDEPKVLSPIEKLLDLVANRKQDQAELMIQENKKLLLLSASVTDPAKRTFNNITCFQYATWARDRHTWKMILKYLPEDEAAQQLLDLELKGTEHGRHYSFVPIILEYLVYCDYAEKVWNYDHSAQYQWCKVIGDLQRKFPVFVVNEFCHPTRSLHPIPDFKEATLPENRKLRFDEDWYTAELGADHEITGRSVAFQRNNQADCQSLIGQVEPAHLGVDLQALIALAKICEQELEALRVKLLSKRPEYPKILAIASLEQLEKKEKSPSEAAKKSFALQNELVGACERGDSKAVRAALEKGASTSGANSLGKKPLAAAVWGMNPEIVSLLVSRSAGKKLMDWAECESHNQRYYNNTFMFMNFNPKDVFEWDKLLNLMVLSPFLQTIHVQNIEKSYGVADWDALKKKVHDTLFDLDSNIDSHAGTTAEAFIKLTTQIKEMITGVSATPKSPLTQNSVPADPTHPQTDLFKKSKVSPPSAGADQGSKCLIM